MIKAVIFDFFGVICSDEYWNFVKQDRYANTVFRDYSEDVNLGVIPWQNFVHKIAKATNKSIDQVNQMYEAENIDPRVVGLIHELHKTYKTGLLTNAHHEFIDKVLKSSNIIHEFDEIVVSSRVGVIKPNPKIFKYALTMLGVEAGEVIYIDDLERHVSAAKELGMYGVVYKDFEQCNSAINQLLHHV